MDIHDHSPTARGWLFLWGGVLLGLVVMVALFTGGFGLLGEGRGASGETPQLVRQGDRLVVPEGSALRQQIKVSPAAAEAVNATLTLPALVESDPARTAAVLPQLGGRVLDLKVGLGDRVAAGQVLAVIDSADLAQAYDDNDKAADALALTTRNLSRQEGQSKIGAASDRDLDQTASDHRQAEAEYTRTQARLKVLGVSLEPGQRSATLTVRAPVAGSITALSVARGDMINDPTQPLMTIADLSTVWVTALVAEKDLAAVAKGEDAEVALSAYPNQPRHGTVSFVSDVVESDSRRNKLRIVFANADHTLKPNMFATVTVHGAPQTRVVLPTSALLMNNDRTSVFVATAPWTFERRVVDLQLGEGDSVAIRSGIAAGDQVVVRGGILLND
jgi:cobalt-zinc-cadmium efflux system membrane fusion protein